MIQPFVFEEWKIINIDSEDIKSNKYYISNFGRIKSDKDFIIKTRYMPNGYQYCSLLTDSGNPKYKRHLNHRLEMKVFNPIEDVNNLTVNHKDLDKKNNYVENLEWVSQRDNNIHSILNHKLYGSGNYQSVFSYDDLKNIVKGLNENKSYTEILKSIGMEANDNNRDYIGNIKRGKTYKIEVAKIKEEFNDYP